MPYVPPNRWRQIMRSRRCAEHDKVCGPERLVMRPPGTDGPICITWDNVYVGWFRQDAIERHLPDLYRKLQVQGTILANFTSWFPLWQTQFGDEPVYQALEWVFSKIYRYEVHQCRHRRIKFQDPGNTLKYLFRQLETAVAMNNGPGLNLLLDVAVGTIEVISELLEQYGFSDKILEDFVKDAEFLIPFVAGLPNQPLYSSWMYKLAESVVLASRQSVPTLVGFLRNVGVPDRVFLKNEATQRYFAGDAAGWWIATYMP